MGRGHEQIGVCLIAIISPRSPFLTESFAKTTGRTESTFRVVSLTEKKILLRTREKSRVPISERGTECTHEPEKHKENLVEDNNREKEEAVN